MRTFGTEADNLIDVELAYGTNNYQLTWFQNGLQRDIEVTKATIHFVGAKLPLGNVTIDYMELNTSYLNFLEEDAIRIDITEDDTTLTVGTFYVAPGFTKTKYDASYTAYSSLVDLGLKLDAWDGAPESATIKDIVHHFTEPLNLVFDVEPSSTLTFNASVADFSSITLGELIGYCACIEQCNYVLRGNVLHKVVPTTAITKEYNIDDVVYSENLSQTTSDATLDYIKVNYKTVSRTTDDDGQVSYDFNDASYICKDGTESCGFELNIGLVPTSESTLQARFSTYFSDVKGMDCNSYNISFLGDARVEVGDKLKFSNSDIAAVLNVSELIWEWDGGLKCTISSGAESNNSSGSGFSIQQVVSQIQAMTNAIKNVQYNAVYANELYAKTAELGFASINELTTEVAKMGFLTAGEADIAYAKIDFSNIEKATIGQMFADIGLVSDMTIVDGHITGTLSGVKITGDLFEANTIKADSLLLTGEDGVIYRINATASGLSKEELSDEKYQKYLSGTDIVSGSITTAQLAANAVTAEKIAAKAITAAHIAASTITGKEIASGTITADKLNVDELFSKNINFTGSIVSTSSVLKNEVWEHSKVEINKTDLSDDNGNDVIYIGYAGNIPHAIGGANYPVYHKVFSVTSKGKVDICAPTYEDAALTITYDPDIEGASDLLFSHCHSVFTPVGINTVMTYQGTDNIFNSGYNSDGFAIRIENNGAYQKLIEARIGDGEIDDSFVLKLTNNISSKSIELDGNTGICTAENFKTNAGVSLTTIDANLANKVNKTDTIAIANGGTGATTASAARTNLGITKANLGITGYTILNVQRASVSTGSTISSGATKTVTATWSSVSGASGYIIALNSKGNSYGRITPLSAYVTTNSVSVNCDNESSGNHTITGYLTVIAIKQL